MHIKQWIIPNNTDTLHIKQWIIRNNTDNLHIKQWIIRNNTDNLHIKQWIIRNNTDTLHMKQWIIRNNTDTLHIKQWIIRNNKEIAYKSLNNRESMQSVLLIYCFICKYFFLCTAFMQRSTHCEDEDEVEDGGLEQRAQRHDEGVKLPKKHNCSSPNPSEKPRILGFRPENKHLS